MCCLATLRHVPPSRPKNHRDEAEGMWISTLQTLGALAGSHFPKVAKGAADALERLVLEVRRFFLLPFDLASSFLGVTLSSLVHVVARVVGRSLLLPCTRHMDTYLRVSLVVFSNVFAQHPARCGG